MLVLTHSTTDQFRNLPVYSIKSLATEKTRIILAKKKKKYIHIYILHALVLQQDTNIAGNNVRAGKVLGGLSLY